MLQQEAVPIAGEEESEENEQQDTESIHSIEDEEDSLVTEQQETELVREGSVHNGIIDRAEEFGIIVCCNFIV